MKRLLLLLLWAVVQPYPPAPCLGIEKGDAPQNHSKNAENRPYTDQRGTDSLPLVVKVLPSPNGQEKAPNEKEEGKHESSADWWMVRLTGIICFIGILQLIVFGLQAKRLKETVEKMDEVAQGQTRDMQATIAEATRAANAMQEVSASMATNVLTVQRSVGITREIADRQKLISELQSRAYLSVVFLGIVPQDRDNNVRFEPRVRLVNRGATPAYKVRFKVAADVVDSPMPDDFGFPLGDEFPHASISVIGQGIEKILSAVVPTVYADEEVSEIKRGTKRRISMWGIVTYEDAFHVERYVKFSFGCAYLSDNTAMSFDTRHHNDAN